VPVIIDDPRIRSFINPVRILWKTSGTVQGEEFLLAPGTGQPSIRHRPGCRLCRQDRDAASLLIDFGCELHGGMQIICGDTTDHKPVRIRLRFGESASEAMAEPDNDHSVHDQIVSLPWLGLAEYGQTGFRFVRIDLAEPNSFVEIVELCAVSLMRPLDYQGAFVCSDERINRIWLTGAHTVHLNMQNVLWDGIKRDRLAWVGDMHPAAAVISAVFGRCEIVEQSLDLVRDETRLPEMMNNLCSYTLQWILIQNDWYLHHGNRAYLEQQMPFLKELLELLPQYIDDHGRENLPGTRLLDWPTARDPHLIHAGLQALLYWALQCGASLCEILGLDPTAQLARKTAERIRPHQPDSGTSKQIAALRVLAGLSDACETNTVVLSRDPYSGISTYFGHYILQARAKADDFQGCLDLIRTYWGAMLDLGATAFWEDFDLAWTENAGRIDELVPPERIDIHRTYGDHCYTGLRHSLCHAWASGPTAWLSANVLGIQPLEPGFAAAAIVPHLGDLEWARGSYPTPFGPIAVEHERDRDGQIHSFIDAPTEIRMKMNGKTDLS